jgi:acyl-CoA thioesterase FadM
MGIKEMDGYGHLWYGNYLKFFERAAVAFLGVVPGHKYHVVVESLKYKRSVPWGAVNSRIETYLVERAPSSAEASGGGSSGGSDGPGEVDAVVYQRWCVGDEKDATFAMAVLRITYRPDTDTGADAGSGAGAGAGAVPGAASAGPAVTDPKERLLGGAGQPKFGMAVRSLTHGAVKAEDLTVAQSIGTIRIYRTVYEDMVDEARRLHRVDVMDLFEQSRTEVVGGQRGLKTILDRGLALVVGRIDMLEVQSDPLASAFLASVDGGGGSGRGGEGRGGGEGGGGGEGKDGGGAGAAGPGVVCEVKLLREYADRRCFDFHQRLLRQSDGSEVASVRVLMCCVDVAAGSLAVVPDDCWEQWQARVERG